MPDAPRHLLVVAGCLSPRRQCWWKSQQTVLERLISEESVREVARRLCPSRRTLGRWWQWLEAGFEVHGLHLRKRYRNLLTRGEKELPPIPAKHNGKRGRLAKSDAHNLWERLKRHEQAVLRFARLTHVPFTNNRAERDLRMSKVKQKVSGCFRTPQYAGAYCRISSYLQTMARRGYNPLVAIQMALSGQIFAQTGE